VIQASLQARDLVRQILAFSRKQEILKRPVDLVTVTRESLQMLRASVPSTVELVEILQPVPPMLADAGQLHQVIINLVTNAAHAIGERVGRVTIKVALAPPRPGDTAVMILLSVADTGCGMDPKTTQRIFEPFYTTKPVGEGTGLGLSVVHGIVTGHGGTIEVGSEPGKGSEFIVRLPSCDARVVERVDAEATA
jgi:signal transduction histidine kinase